MLQLVRRLDGALGPQAKVLAARTVMTDRELGRGPVEGDAASALPASPADPTPDAAVTDLARLWRATDNRFGSVLDGYESVSVLGEQERLALPLLAIALELDDLAEALTTWAAAGPENPPRSTRLMPSAPRSWPASTSSAFPTRLAPAGAVPKLRPAKPDRRWSGGSEESPPRISETDHYVVGPVSPTRGAR